MVSSRLKEKLEGVFAAGATPLASLGLTPNTLTALGLITSTIAAWSYLNWRTDRTYLAIAGTLILLSGLIDALDGALARKLGKVSASGAFLDSVSDRYSDAVVLSAIVVSELCNPSWGLAAIVGSLMVSYSRARAEAAGVAMIAIGLAERAERMIFLVLVTYGSFFRLDLLGWGIIILAVAANLTVVQRAVHFFNNVKKA